MEISNLVPNSVTQQNTQQVVDRDTQNRAQEKPATNEVQSRRASDRRDVRENNFNQVEVVLEQQDASSASDLPRGSVLDITV